MEDEREDEVGSEAAANRYLDLIEKSMANAADEKKAFMEHMRVFVGSDLHTALKDMILVIVDNLKDQHLWAENGEDRSICKGGVLALGMLIDVMHQAAVEVETADPMGTSAYGSVMPLESEADPGI